MYAILSLFAVFIGNRVSAYSSVSSCTCVIDGVASFYYYGGLYSTAAWRQTDARLYFPFFFKLVAHGGVLYIYLFDIATSSTR